MVINEKILISTAQLAQCVYSGGTEPDAPNIKAQVLLVFMIQKE